jgi:hypothetical protein
MSLMALNINSRASSSAASNLTLLAHTLPLTPGSLVVMFCALVIADEGEFGPIISRSIFTVIEVRRSHFEAVGDKERPCHNAVFIKNGVLGSSNFTSAEGDESIVARSLRGADLRLEQCTGNEVVEVAAGKTSIMGYHNTTLERGRKAA